MFITFCHANCGWRWHTGKWGSVAANASFGPFNLLQQHKKFFQDQDSPVTQPWKNAANCGCQTINIVSRKSVIAVTYMLLRTMADVLRAQLRMSWSAIFRSALRTLATAK